MRARSSWCAVIRSNQRRRMRLRSAAGRAAQSFCAAAAAAIAARVSLSPISGTSAKCSPVAGLRTDRVRPLSARRHVPSIRHSVLNRVLSFSFMLLLLFCCDAGFVRPSEKAENEIRAFCRWCKTPETIRLTAGFVFSDGLWGRAQPFRVRAKRMLFSSSMWSAKSSVNSLARAYSRCHEPQAFSGGVKSLVRLRSWAIAP